MIFIELFLVLSLIGMLDKLLNGRFGLSPAFDEGIAAMGPLCISTAGIYCGAVYLLEQCEGGIVSLQQRGVDASVLFGALLAPDLGGFPMAERLAQTAKMGSFSGVLVASTLGGFISFALPTSFSLLPQRERPIFMEGVLLGIAALPVGLLPGGLLLGMEPAELMKGVMPIMGLCGLLMAGLRLFPNGLLKVFIGFGNLIRFLGMVLFAVVVFGLFFPNHAVFSRELSAVGFEIVVKTAVVVSGSLVANQLLMRFVAREFQWAAWKMKTNVPAIMGLVITLVTSVSMIPLYDQMDERGKRMNAAFAVGAAFCLGGQMSYVVTLAESTAIPAYFACKLICGIAAVVLTCLLPSHDADCGHTKRTS